MTRNTQGTQATNTYAWLLEMVKRNAFIIQLDKWKQLVWMLWYIDSLLKSRQNCLQVGSMAISILMSRFIYAKKYCFNQEQGGQHGSKWQNPVGLVSSGAGTGGGGACDCPPTPVMVPPWVRDPRAKAQETLPHKVLPWVHSHQAGSCY